MKKIVVDASVAVKWLNQHNEESTEQAFALLESARNGDIDMITSDLLVHEVFNALVRGKGIADEELNEAYKDFFLFPFTIVSTDQGIARLAGVVAQKFLMSIYDAVYVALALKLDALLITANFRHQGKVGDVGLVMDLVQWKGLER